MPAGSSQINGKLTKKSTPENTQFMLNRNNYKAIIPLCLLSLFWE